MKNSKLALAALALASWVNAQTPSSTTSIIDNISKIAVNVSGAGWKIRTMPESDLPVCLISSDGRLSTGGNIVLERKWQTPKVMTLAQVDAGKIHTWITPLEACKTATKIRLEKFLDGK